MDTKSGSISSTGSMTFHALRDRLIHQQWQLDREQQHRIDREPQALGVLAQLPPELRSRVYRACLPTEHLDIDLIEQSYRERHGSNLLSLMRTTRCIHDEIKPLLEEHVHSRLFNLVMSKKGVRFERKQLNVDYLRQDTLRTMTSATFPPLSVFARARNRIRNLRLTIQIQPTVLSAGLVAALEPFAMWVFSLLSRAEALQILLVDFHLSSSFPSETLTNDDGGEMSIGRLIGTLLGARAAEHCQIVMKQAMTSALQVVRFVVHQNSNIDGHPDNVVKSWRWTRLAHFQQPASQSEAKLPDAMPAQSQPGNATQSVDSRALPECLPPPSQVDEVLSTEQSSIQSVEETEKVDDVEPTYLQPPPAKERVSTKSPSLTAVLIDTANGAEEDYDAPESINAESQEDEILSTAPMPAVPVVVKSVSSSSKILNEEPKLWASENAITNKSDSSTQPYPSPSTLKRRRKHRPVGQRHKRQRLELTTGSGSSTPQPASSNQTPRSSKSRSHSPKIEVAVKMDEYVVQSLRDVRIKNGVSQIKVKWNGFDQMTWEPRATLMEDVPEMVREFDRRRWKPQVAQTTNGNKEKAQRASFYHTVPRAAAADERSNEVPEQSVETPQTATTRINEWKAQKQRLSSPVSGSSHHKTPRYASKAPKRPLTAYFIFMQANQPSIWNDLCKKLGGPELVKENLIATEGTRRWLALEPEQRKIWESMHAKRVAVYHVQMEAFKAGQPVPSHEQARSLTESRETSFMDLT